jgi:iron complex outermembrane receptor protein
MIAPGTTKNERAAAAAILTTALFTAAPTPAMAEGAPAKVARTKSDPQSQRVTRDQDEPTEVIVSATRTERAVDFVPASASVLNADTLAARAFDRLDEALNLEAGLYDGRMRGTSSASHTLVMLNGMPLNSGWYGGTQWKNIAMENVDRIEVVRGPGSSLYGGNAMGGTVNVITKLPQAFEASLRMRTGSDDYASYGASIGARFLDRFALRIGAEYDDELVGRPIDYVLRPVTAGSGTLTGGEYSPSRVGRDSWIVGDKGERNERQWNVNLTAAWEISETGSLRLDAQEGLMALRNGPPASYVRDAGGQSMFSGNVQAGANQRVPIGPTLFLDSPGDEQNSASMLTYTDRFGRVDLVAKAGYQHEDKWYTLATANSGDYDSASGNVREFDTDTFIVDVQATRLVGARNLVTAGLYGRKNTFDQAQHDVAFYRDRRSKLGGVTEITRGADRYYAAYVQDELAVTPNVRAYLGARIDGWEAYGGLSGPAAAPLTLSDTDHSAFSPSASVVWELNDGTAMHASVAKAFSAPTIYDRYRTFVSGSQLILSNPALRPESLVNHEIGIVRYALDRRLRVALTGFLMRYKDLVYSYAFDDLDDVDGNPLTTLVSSTANAGEARNAGFEVVVKYRPLEWIGLWANYTANHTKITRNELSPATVGKRFTYSPDRIANVGADARYGWLRASMNATYTGRVFRMADNADTFWGVYQTDSVGWMSDLKLTTTIPAKVAGPATTTIGLIVRNLFDEKYFEYGIGRPRSYYLELAVRF